MSLSSVHIVPTQFQNITLAALFLVKMMYDIRNGFPSSNLSSAGGMFSRLLTGGFVATFNASINLS
jgi:hypothetical protein